MTTALICAHCGTGFTTTNQQAKSGRKYCSSVCYRAREMINGPRKLVEPIKFQCKQCGEEFTKDPGELRSYKTKHGRGPLYCSIECGGVGRRKLGEVKICVQCGKEMVWRDGGIGRHRVVCSQECRRALKKSQMLEYFANRTPVARSGRHGYMRMSVRKKPNEKAVEILEHRYNMQQHLGRDLLPGETVHHIDGNRSNNKLENLELFSSRHGPGQRVSDQLAWVVKFVRDYPEMSREAGIVMADLFGQALTPCL